MLATLVLHSKWKRKIHGCERQSPRILGASSLLVVGSLIACCHPGPSGTARPVGSAPTSANSFPPESSAAARAGPVGSTQPPTRRINSAIDLRPDQRAICLALDSAEEDQWQRFTGLIPIELGGVILVLRGDANGASRVIAKLSLRETAVVPCSQGRLVTWIHCEDTRALPALVEMFERDGTKFVRQFVFPAAEAASRIREKCKDARACCEFGRLLCRFADHEATAETCADGIAEPPPEWGIRCDE